jgi:hypothetical protein
MPPGSGPVRDRMALAAHRRGPVAHGIHEVGNRLLDGRPVRHAAREIGKLDQVAAALVLGLRPDGEAGGRSGTMPSSRSTNRTNARTWAGSIGRRGRYAHAFADPRMGQVHIAAAGSANLDAAASRRRSRILDPPVWRMGAHPSRVLAPDPSRPRIPRVPWTIRTESTRR